MFHFSNYHEPRQGIADYHSGETIPGPESPHQHKVQFRIHVDFGYSHQSYAIVELWDGTQWHKMSSLIDVPVDGLNMLKEAVQDAYDELYSRARALIDF